MSGFDPFASDSPLVVYIDVKSPYAFVAIEPTFELEDELGIAADWRPLTLDIPSYLGSARLDERGNVAEQNRTPGQWAAVKYAYRDARRYAALRGLTLRGTVKIWDTSLAHIGMMWAKRQGREVLRAYLRGVYLPFWRRELDAEDPAAIAQVLARAGAELTGFDAFLCGEGRAEHDAMQPAIFDAGIFGVPSYVVAGELFFGREHLPRVRWLLSGKKGPAPDIAYRRFGGDVVERSVGGPAERGAGDQPPAARTPAAGRGAGSGPAPLTVAIDFRQPHSYLALAPTRALAAARGVAIDWRPFEARSLEPPPTSGAEGAAGAGAAGATEAATGNRTTRHFRHRARYFERDLRRYAEVQGLELRELDRAPDPSAAGAGLLFAKREIARGAAAPGAASAYVELVFDRYWAGGLDLEDPEAIRRVLAQAGVEGTATFDSRALRDDYEREVATLREAGAVTAPAYLVGGEVFIGREHLPMVRWLLEGRAGAPPG